MSWANCLFFERTQAGQLQAPRTCVRCISIFVGQAAPWGSPRCVIGRHRTYTCSVTVACGSWSWFISLRYPDAFRACAHALISGLQRAKITQTHFSHGRRPTKYFVTDFGFLTGAGAIGGAGRSPIPPLCLTRYQYPPSGLRRRVIR